MRFQLCLLLVFPAFFVDRSHAAGDTVYVSTTGNDDNPGTQTQPFQTIQKSADVAQSGDTVLVMAGSYPEEITLRESGVAFRAFGTQRPVIDGEGVRRFGIHNQNWGDDIDDIVIDGFEIANQTYRGIHIEGAYKENWLVRNNLVHHIPDKGIALRGSSHRIENNIVYMIANEQEAMGIYLSASDGCTVQGNQVYLVKKTGIRDQTGSNNVIENNIVHTCWTGLDFNSSTACAAYNNYFYRTASYGFNPKHTTGDQGWSVFWHNTVYDSGLASIGIGINDPPLDYIDIRNNIFSKGGKSHIVEITPVTGSNLVLDGNLYHRANGRPLYFYYTAWEQSSESGPASIAEIQVQTSYEDNGMEFDPRFSNPEEGDLDYPDSSPAAQGSLVLPSVFGNQLGARGLIQTIPDFIRLPITAIAASTNEQQMSNTTDHLHYTTWDSGSANTNQWIIYDFGQTVSFKYIIQVPFSHKTEHNIRNFSFEASLDNLAYSTILSGTNNDSGSIFIYELGSPVTARYLRFNLIDKFPDDGLNWTLNQLKFSDLWVGNTVPKTTAPPRPPANLVVIPHSP